MCAYFDRENRLKIAGVNAVKAAFASRPEDFLGLYFQPDRKASLAETIAHCEKRKIFYKETSSAEIEKIAASSHHEGVCAVTNKIQPPSFDEFVKPLLSKDKVQLLVLDEVKNPHNIGAIVRTAAHFGITAILVTTGVEGLYSSAMYRVAEGGLEYVPVISTNIATALKTLAKNNFQIYTTSGSAKGSAYDVKFSKKCALVLGAEGTGVSKEILSTYPAIKLPGTGVVESLNVSVAAGILMSVMSEFQ